MIILIWIIVMAIPWALLLMVIRMLSTKGDDDITFRKKEMPMARERSYATAKQWRSVAASCRRVMRHIRSGTIELPKDTVTQLVGDLYFYRHGERGEALYQSMKSLSQHKQGGTNARTNAIRKG